MEMKEAEELKQKFGLVRMRALEEVVEKLVARVELLETEKGIWKGQLDDREKKWSGKVKALESELGEVKKEKEKIKEENKSLKEEISEVKKCEEEIQSSVRNVEKKQFQWEKVNVENEQSLQEIMKHQEKEKQEIEKKIVSVIKEKKMVRDTVDKVKCVVLFGVKEDNIVDRLERERKEKENIRQIIAEVVEDEDRALNQVEEIHRIGKYEENKDRPLKVKFATQTQAEEIINGGWKLANKVEWKKFRLTVIWMKRRERNRELVKDAKVKNDNRTEEERKKFYWKAVDLRLRKKYYRK